MKKISFIVCFFVSFMVKSQEISITKLSLSTTGYDEFMPSYHPEGLIYVSNKKNHIVKTVVEIENGKEKYLNDVFLAKFNSKDSSRFIIQSFSFNRDNQHDGPATINNGKNKIIFAGNNEHSKENNKVALFETNLKDGKWTESVLLRFINKDYNYSHPFLTADESKLYFASDLPGGLGGMDIWYVEKENGKWSLPKNVGAPINTSWDEMSPFVNHNNLFCWASNLDSGLGGFDVYSLDLGGGSVNHYPAPINSVKDEYSLITKDEVTGYFSSNRNGSDDIFSFEVEIAFPDSCVNSERVEKCFTFYDDTPIGDTLPLIYKWYFGDGTVGFGSESRHCYLGSGNYEIKLSLVDTTTENEIEGVGSYELNIGEVFPYYIGIEEEGNSLVIGVKDSLDQDFLSSDLVWKVNEKIINRREELRFFAENNFSGAYKVSVTNIHKDNVCYSNSFFTGKLNNDRIRLIPGMIYEESWISPVLWDIMIESNYFNKSSKMFILHPTNYSLEELDWINNFKLEFADEFGISLAIKSSKEVNETFLILKYEN